MRAPTVTDREAIVQVRARAAQLFRAFTAKLTTLGERDRNCLVLIAITVVASMALQWRSLINSDAAFLAWTARQVMGPAVFGVDIYEVNPPLAFMLYSPAAFVAPVLGFDLAIKLWISLLAGLSIACVWNTAGRSLRMAVALMLSLFFLLGFPAAFGQREFFAFLLCAPYVAGNSPRRGWAVLSGVMAGVGFAIKPHFLIALVLVFATRRKIRAEEIAIAATGAVYAAVILIFFQPYLFEFLPYAVPSYGAVYESNDQVVWLSAIIAMSVLPQAIGGAPQPAARGYLMAAIGFTLAVIIQNKGFTYHFIPAWGFLTLFLVARLFNARLFTAVVASLFLLGNAALFGWISSGWFYEKDTTAVSVRLLLKELDTSSSFLALSFSSLPAFPAALYTRSEYVGKSFYPIYLKTVKRMDAGEIPGDPSEAMRLSLEQALSELARKPEIIIVPVSPKAARGQISRDVLSLLSRNRAYDVFWKTYVLEKTVDKYQIYRRR
ncbi:hypothetical protein [Aestuariivirga sp.]|uniref:hypothetical protein n=1 Tax=Aestuariivirga sp. TaxID=2650926 RepID=UPI003BAD57C5